ncbi:hypothetical protein pb186bvf_001865 [Paramecium bursaria]
MKLSEFEFQFAQFNRRMRCLFRRQDYILRYRAQIFLFVYPKSNIIQGIVIINLLKYSNYQGSLRQIYYDVAIIKRVQQQQIHLISVNILKKVQNQQLNKELVQFRLVMAFIGEIHIQYANLIGCLIIARGRLFFAFDEKDYYQMDSKLNE